MKRVNKQKGFTIIELVVVILLLGILTATALPRFMDVTDEAHDAVVLGVIGGMNTGAAMFKAQWYAQNQSTAGLAEFGGMRPYAAIGYPLGLSAVAATSAVTSMVNTQDCVEVFTNLLQPGGRPTIGSISSDAGVLTADDITSSTTDFLAYLNRATSITKRQCVYAYTGQFTNASTQGIPLITYDAATGTVSLSATEL